MCLYVCVPQYESSGLGLISSRLRTTLNRIQESLIDMVGQQLSVPLYTLHLLLLHLFFYSLFSSLALSPLPVLVTSLPVRQYNLCSYISCLYDPLCPCPFTFFPLPTLSVLAHSVYCFKKKKHGQCHHKMHYRSLCDQWSPPL